MSVTVTVGHWLLADRDTGTEDTGRARRVPRIGPPGTRTPPGPGSESVRRAPGLIY